MVKVGGVTVRTVKNAPLPEAPELIIDYRRWDASLLLGKATQLTTGAPTNQWDPILRRYTRRGFVSASGVTERTQQWIEPRAIIDPRYPPTGLILRIRSALHLRLIDNGAGVPGLLGNYIRCAYGFAAQPGLRSSLNNNQKPFIGIRLDLLGGTGITDPTWHTEYVNWDQSQRRSIDTGIKATTVRDVMVELSGVDQKVRWYFDNELVDTYAPTADDVGGQNTTPAEWVGLHEVVASAVGAAPTAVFSWNLGAGPLTTVTYHDA